MTSWTIATLELLFSAFSFLTGWYLLCGGKPSLRRAAVCCGGMLAAYWAVFLPRLLWLRAAGLSDIGRMTILREAFGLGNSVLPFAGYIGGYALSVLLCALLARVRSVHPAASWWLHVVMPVTAAEVVVFYAPMQPELCRALQNLQLVVGCMGAGCALRRWPLPLRATKRSVRALLALAALAGHYALPQMTLGALQLMGNRVSFAFDLDMFYVPALLLAIGGGRGVGTASAPPEREALPLRLDREVTGAIKGLCVVMMFVHHFFTLPTWYVEGISYPELAGFADLFQLPLAICVPVFAFLTGYFYAPRRDKTLRYSLHKIAQVLAVYWIIQALLFLLAAICGAQLTAAGFLWEMIGLESHVMLFNWYIAFYIMAMLLLPALSRLPQGNPLTASLSLIGLPILGATAVRALVMPQSHAAVAAQYMLDGVTGLGAGYIAARFGLLHALGQMLRGRRGVHPAVSAALMLLALFGRKFAPRLVIPLPGLTESWALRVSMDVLYAPVFVFALAQLIPLLPRACRRMLLEMGRYSLHMWLISCLFFNAGKAVCQPLLYLPRHPLLVSVWGLVFCYAAGRLADIPARWLLGEKKFS